MKKFLTIFFIFFSLFSFSATFNSIQDGDWNNDNTWDGVGIPNSNGDVIHIYHNVAMTNDIGFSFDSLVIHPGAELVGNYDLEVKSGCYLGIYGYLEVCNLTFKNGSDIYFDIGSSVQVNCDLTNNNNSDDVIINGTVNVDGTFDNGNGGDITGGGIIIATDYTGNGTTFGVSNDEYGESLPIELLYFKAECIDDIVEIKWATASEINNNYFTIEKSINGISFQFLGLVNGTGNSNEKQVYEYYDVCSQSTYYRLTQTDFDGKFVTYPLIYVSKQINEILNISECKIFDMSGKQIKENSIHELPIGIYIVIKGEYKTKLIIN